MWRDADRDGVSDEGELVSLSELGIISIILDYSTLNSNTASGATLGNVSRFVYEDGSESRIAEYWVLSQKFNTVDTNPIDIPEDIAALPDIKSMGNAFSLHKAMTLDTTGRLVDLVNDFSTTYDETERKVIIDQILLILTGAETVEADSRGPYIDAQKLTALECLLGQEFTGQNGENPNSVAAPLLISAYNTLAEMYYCELIAKTSLSDMLGYIKRKMAMYHRLIFRSLIKRYVSICYMMIKAWKSFMMQLNTSNIFRHIITMAVSMNLDNIF